MLLPGLRLLIPTSTPSTTVPSTPTFQPRIEADQDTGNATADLYIASDMTFSRTKGEEGLWTEPIGPNFTGSGEVDVSGAVAEGNDFEIGAAVLTFGWNTNLVSEPLTDYEDLLRPDLAGGKIGVIEPTAAPPVDFYLWLEDTFGEEYVEALAAQEPRIYSSALPMAEALASGETRPRPTPRHPSSSRSRKAELRLSSAGPRQVSGAPGTGPASFTMPRTRAPHSCSRTG